MNHSWANLWAYSRRNRKSGSSSGRGPLTRAQKPQEVLDRVHHAPAARELEGGGALLVALLGVRCLLYQQLDHLQVTLCGGQVKGEVTVIVNHVSVCLVLQQLLHRILESIAGGIVQHGETAGRVSQIWVRSSQQKFQHQGVVARLYHLRPDRTGERDECARQRRRI